MTDLEEFVGKTDLFLGAISDLAKNAGLLHKFITVSSNIGLKLDAHDRAVLDRIAESYIDGGNKIKDLIKN